MHKTLNIIQQSIAIYEQIHAILTGFGIEPSPFEEGHCDEREDGCGCYAVSYQASRDGLTIIYGISWDFRKNRRGAMALLYFSLSDEKEDLIDLTLEEGRGWNLTANNAKLREMSSPRERMHLAIHGEDASQELAFKYIRLAAQTFQKVDHLQ